MAPLLSRPVDPSAKMVQALAPPLKALVPSLLALAPPLHALARPPQALAPSFPASSALSPPLIPTGPLAEIEHARVSRGPKRLVAFVAGGVEIQRWLKAAAKHPLYHRHLWELLRPWQASPGGAGHECMHVRSPENGGRGATRRPTGRVPSLIVIQAGCCNTTSQPSHGLGS